MFALRRGGFEMTWLLLIFVTSYNSAAIESHEFHGESRCQEARKQVVLHMSDSGKDVTALCVRK
ncbi:hypothetical protein SFP17_069 [Shigella phage SFP17]|uniref:Uncharacterized protein n=2 Tax=Hanrivervirus TaxID=2560145 RepID=A0AAE6V6A0_9CAUD|nr:hypothetical protein SFP17_069 [Shigella phage SFP17]